MEAASFIVHSIEPSEAFSRKAVEQLGGDSCSDRLKSIDDAVFYDESFDFLTSGAVRGHIDDPCAAIKKVLKWVQPGGIVHAEVLGSNYIISRLINAYTRLSEQVLKVELACAV